MRKALLLLFAMLFIVPALAALPADVSAKFVKILAASAGSAGQVACKDSAVAAELTKAGVTVNPDAKVAYAASAGEVKSYKAAGKMVICGDLNQLPLGGAIAIVEEGGKPAIYLHMGNISGSGVVLSDAVLKIGKRL